MAGVVRDRPVVDRTSIVSSTIVLSLSTCGLLMTGSLTKTLHANLCAPSSSGFFVVHLLLRLAVSFRLLLAFPFHSYVQHTRLKSGARHSSSQAKGFGARRTKSWRVWSSSHSVPVPYACLLHAPWRSPSFPAPIPLPFLFFFLSKPPPPLSLAPLPSIDQPRPFKATEVASEGKGSEGGKREKK